MRHVVIALLLTIHAAPALATGACPQDCALAERDAGGCCLAHPARTSPLDWLPPERRDPRALDCAREGTRLLASDARRDQRAAVRVLDRACGDGCSGACARLGHELIGAYAPGIRRDVARGLERLERACTLDATECNPLAEYLEHGEVVAAAHDFWKPIPRDLPRALLLYRRSCDAGFLFSCGKAGRMLRRGDGAPADAALAADYLSRGCDAGLDADCTGLAELLRDGDGVPRDPTRALRLFFAACDRGQPDACAQAAALIRGPHAVEMDARALALYRLGCERFKKGGHYWQLGRARDCAEAEARAQRR